MIRDLALLAIFLAIAAFAYAVTSPPIIKVTTVETQVSAGIEEAAKRLVKENIHDR